MRIAGWIPKSTNTHSEYVIVTSFSTATMVARNTPEYYVIRTLLVYVTVSALWANQLNFEVNYELIRGNMRFPATVTASVITVRNAEGTTLLMASPIIILSPVSKSSILVCSSRASCIP